MKLDHARAVRDPAYLARKRSKLERAAVGVGMRHLDVVHDHDRACCRREAWSATLAKLAAPAIAAAAARDPRDVAALIAEHEPAIIVAARGIDDHR